MQAENRSLTFENSLLRSQLSAEQRAQRKQINSINAEWQTELADHEVETVDRLREQEQELRAYQQRMHDERNQATVDAAAITKVAEELRTTLKRLRSSSKNELLGQVAELQAKVTSVPCLSASINLS